MSATFFSRRASGSATAIARAAAHGHLVDRADQHRHIVRADDEYDGIAVVDGAQGAVLELGAEHPLAVGVRDFLQLEGSLQRDPVGQAISELVEIGAAVECGKESAELDLGCLIVRVSRPADAGARPRAGSPGAAPDTRTQSPGS